MDNLEMHIIVAALFVGFLLILGTIYSKFRKASEKVDELQQEIDDLHEMVANIDDNIVKVNENLCGCASTLCAYIHNISNVESWDKDLKDNYFKMYIKRFPTHDVYHATICNTNNKQCNEFERKMMKELDEK